ncbi:DUF397 domain-containing protein [Saccharopolyspora endophytica]|uniref:DUF397 domain-containing protein n=1 Tax=Saccharopolyspora endophytica TaxID=543886 RepID=A0ABS5DI21_9PSEU|nr:DUF397 domain-containing protein [Saccharopolyspora endophytica]MBQ0925943.1 DUF397 domain-containing protein [Saccharopolyspora endophytica]
MNANAFTNWRKSTSSNGPPAVRRSRRSPDLRGVRDSKLGDAGPILVFGRRAWSKFLTSLKFGKTDT